MTIEVAFPVNVSRDFLLDASEKQHAKFSDVAVSINSVDYGPGDLTVGSKRVYWVSYDDPQTVNFAVDYQTIVVHAVCCDTQYGEPPCLYCQFDVDFDLVETMCKKIKTVPEKPCVADDASDFPTEVRFIPADKSVLNGLFESFCDMARLNPDDEPPTLDNEWCTAVNQEQWCRDIQHTIHASDDLDDEDSAIDVASTE